MNCVAESVNFFPVLNFVFLAAQRKPNVKQSSLDAGLRTLPCVTKPVLLCQFF